MSLPSRHIEALTRIAGPGGATTDQDLIAPHCREWRDKFTGRTDLMLTPMTTDTVSRCLAYANAHGLAVKPQGGNTGLVGGSTPGLEGRTEILLSLKKMTMVTEPDAASSSLVAEAGATIASVQDRASGSDLMFPLSLASEGSCTVGGTIATNAGGVHVIRYGTMRSLTMGVECVLADGQVLDATAPLIKDNTGYALSSLIAGSEGTIGVITRARLKLVAPERTRTTALLAAGTADDTLRLLGHMRSRFGDCLSAFEAISEAALDLAVTHTGGVRRPYGEHADWHVLVELGTADPEAPLRDRLESELASQLEAGLLKSGVVAQSLSDRQAFWQLREGLSEAQKKAGASIKHDISLPLDQIPHFLSEAGQLIETMVPGSRPTPFGHLGDGNLHYNILETRPEKRRVFLTRFEPVNHAIHDLVVRLGGSISAEHGIGTLKREDLARLKPDAAVSSMRAIKTALDPNGILNPGVLTLPPTDAIQT